MKTVIIAAIAAVSLASCANPEKYAKLDGNEYQIAGHPYKSAKDCKRKAPVGKFDGKCDIPVLGYRGFFDPSTVVLSDGTGSLPF